MRPAVAVKQRLDGASGARGAAVARTRSRFLTAPSGRTWWQRRRGAGAPTWASLNGAVALESAMPEESRPRRLRPDRSVRACRRGAKREHPSTMSGGSFLRSRRTEAHRRLSGSGCGRRSSAKGSSGFYDPAQLARLKAHAHSSLDAAICTLGRSRPAAERDLCAQDPKRRLRKRHPPLRGRATRDVAATPATKRRRVLLVRMSANVRAVLLPYCQGRRGEALSG